MLVCIACRRREFCYWHESTIQLQRPLQRFFLMLRGQFEIVMEIRERGFDQHCNDNNNFHLLRFSCQLK